MILSSSCMYCIITRQMDVIKTLQDEEVKSNYMKEVLKILFESKDGDTAPVITARISELHEKFFSTPYSFDTLKHYYNIMMLEKENELRQVIQKSDDTLLTAIKYARIGNYIDFGAMSSVSDEKLEALLDRVSTEQIDTQELQQLKIDLSHAKSFVYITDNCGEIVLDKLLIEVIRRQYPSIQITAIVRGEPVLNDATLEDANMVGLSDMIPVIGNGTKVAGTAIDLVNSSAREALESADVIISKGQGNFESLHGCGLNIYYMFLCKCDWFVNRFHLKKFEGVFINEKNQSIA